MSLFKLLRKAYRFRISQKGTYPNFKIEFKQWLPFWTTYTGSNIGLPMSVELPNGTRYRTYYEGFIFKDIATATYVAEALIAHTMQMQTPYHVVKEF